MKLYSIAALTLFVVLLSCSGEEEATEKNTFNGKYGGVFVTNQFQDFSTLFPPAAYENSSSQIGTHLYETLVRYEGKNQTLSPSLASKWEVNDDATVFTLTIRKGVYFHDNDCFKDGIGRVMTSEDIMYCLRKLCSNFSKNKNSWLLLDKVKGASEFYEKSRENPNALIEGIELLKDGRIQFKLDSPYVEFLHVLAHYGTSIYPKEMLDFYKSELNYIAVGTGAFKTKWMTKGKIAIFERNDKYWGRSKNGDKLPYLDGVKVTFEEKSAPIEKAMKEGAIHAVLDADMQEGSRSFNDLVTLNSSGYTSKGELDFEVVYCGFLNDEGIFQDFRIRKAFNYAIDRKIITDIVLNGSGYPGIYGLVPPAFKNYPVSNVKGYDLDIEQAKALLAESGFEDGEGFPAVTLQIQNRFKDVVVAQEIQKQLQENLNVSISLSALPRSEHFMRIENRKASFWLDGWTADFLDPQNFLELMVSQNTPEATGSYLNTYRYGNKTFDDLVSRSASQTNMKGRMKSYSDADNIMMQDAAIMPIYYEKTLVVQKSDLIDLPPPTMGRLDLRSVHMSH